MKNLQSVLHDFNGFAGKPRTDLPWLNGTTKGFPNRVTGFYDCALAVSYFTGITPQIVSCGVLMDYLKKLGTWKTTGQPNKGDVVIFGWSGNKQDHDHTGLVLWVKPNGNDWNVTYVSADSTQNPPPPGLVTVNTVSSKYVTGWGDPKVWDAATVAAPVTAPNHEAVIPVATPAQSAAHASAAV